jgi:hypothetical protein
MVCPLCDCQQPARAVPFGDRNEVWFDCPICGKFTVANLILSREALTADLQVKSRRYLLSALARTSKSCPLIDEDRINKLKEGYPSDKTVGEKFELISRWFADESAEIGQWIPYNKATFYPTGWCRSPAEWQRLFGHLLDDRKFLQFNGDPNNSQCAVTVAGLQWLGEQPRTGSNKGFIAMWFDKSLDPVQVAIEEAISEAGYSPLRIDDDHDTGV